MSPEAPWAELVVLAERERDLVRDGRWEEVPAVSAERLRGVPLTNGDEPATVFRAAPEED